MVLGYGFFMDDVFLDDFVVVEGGGCVRPAVVKFVQGFLRDRGNWELVKVDADKPHKVFTVGAVERFRSFDLTHDELLYLMDGLKDFWQRGVLASHENWDVDWVVENFRCVKDRNFNPYHSLSVPILFHTKRVDLTVRAAELLSECGLKGKAFSHYLGCGSHLDDESLFRLAGWGFGSVLADDRFSEADILDFWDKNLVFDGPFLDQHESGMLYSFYEAILSNYNAPSWLLDEAVVKVWSYASDVYGNPNLSAEALNVLTDRSSWREHRVLIAGHPNVGVKLLKRFAKSAYEPLAGVARGRLAEKDDERRRKFQRNV